MIPRFGLTKEEMAVFQPLSSPIRIQDFLDSLPINHEKQGETNWSPRKVLEYRKAHCMEGAMLAATALLLHGEKPLLLDLKSARGDDDHVVALYRKNGLWGGISKTNHAVLRFRDPLYKTVRELALSYFHEYFINTTGIKTLRSYSLPFNLRRFGTAWITEEDNLWYLANELDDAPHQAFAPLKALRALRKADSMERKAGGLIEWKKSHPRT